MRVNVGRKEKKDGDFVGWEERVRAIGGCGVWWRWSGGVVVEEKRVIRGLIKVTSEYFILSKPAS